MTDLSTRTECEWDLIKNIIIYISLNVSQDICGSFNQKEYFKINLRMHTIILVFLSVFEKITLGMHRHPNKHTQILYAGNK